MASTTTLSPPHRRAWLSLIAALVALATFAVALAPSGAGAQTPTPTPDAEDSIPEPLATAVRARVASEAGVPAADVEIDRADRVVWQNGCLGLEPQDVACTLALVSGHVVWATGGDTTYRLHTDYQGADVRLAASDVTDPATAPLPAGAALFEPNIEALPEPIAAQVTTLAATRAGVPATEVSILRVEDVTWQDACIGAVQGAESCAQVVTEGYVVWVSAGVNVYRYHTADDTSNIRFGEGGLSLADLPLYGLPAGATAAEDGDDGTDGLIVGEVPESGLALLQVSAAATPSTLITALVAQGCAPVSVSITSGGAFVVYIPGAPDFVNQAFPADLAAGTGFVVRCA